MKNDSRKEKSKIPTTKKVALAILGALTLLTVVNLIEAGVNRFSSNDAGVHEEEAMQLDFDEDFHVHVDDNNLNANHNSIRFHIKAEQSAEIMEDGEVMIDRLFEVSQGDLLSVRVGDADIRVNTHDVNEAHVEVYLEGKNMRKAKAYFENLHYEVMQDGSSIYVRTNPERKNFSWDQSGGAQITVDITIPTKFETDIRTSDGDILMGSVEGKTMLHTSDGDVMTESITGPQISIRTSDGDIRTETMQADNINIRTSDGDINVENLQAGEILIRTSDGDIRADRLEGVAAVSTSDGDIYLTHLEGDELDIRTSDGEIVVDDLHGQKSRVQTSDGSIMLRKVSGELYSKTSSGDIRITLTDNSNNVYLRAGDGDIQIEASPDYAATFYLKGDKVRVSSAFSFVGDIKEDEADGTINGGGYSLEARASSGEVIFREN